MDDIERRLRAAMISAAETPPASLMAGIRRRHRRHVRRLSFGCLAVAAAIGLAAPPLTHTLRAAPSLTHGSRARPTLAPTSPAPSPTAAPGTVLLTCDSANWGKLASNWRAGSLKAGPLWFVGGRQGGWVHHGGSNSVGRASHGHGKPSGGVMIVEVASGSTAVMKVAPEARPYFRFLDGFGPNVGYRLPNGDTGFTFIACARGEAGPNGHVTDFYLGFSSKAGSRAPVDVWTPRSSLRPIRVVFTPR